MNIFTISYKNILRKRTRSVLTIVGVGLSAWVLASLLGFNKGYESALNKDIDNMGFQILLTAKGCPYEAATLMLKGGTGLRYLGESVKEQISGYSEIDKVTPMLMQVIFDPNKGESGGISAYLGVDPATFPQMKPFLEFVQGKWFSESEGMEAVLGYEAAELEQREVGDMLLIPEKNIELKVVGILKRTGTQDDGTIFLPMKSVQNIFNRAGEITGLGIKVKKDANIAKLEDALYNLPDVQVVSMAQVKATIINLVSSAKVMVFSIAIIAIVIAMVGVVNTILMSVFERYQEIGILKSMGAMPFDIFKIIWTETIFLCLSGGLLGVLLAFILSKISEVFIRSILPYTPTGSLIEIDVTVACITFGIVTIVGFFSGIIPAWKASSIRPLDAVRAMYV